MTSLIGSHLSPTGAALGTVLGPSTPPAAGAAGFASTLRSAVEEVSRLQGEATLAIEQLTAGQTDDVTGVMAAVEKGELAFKTLLAIRGKLMAAYEEIRNMPI